MEGIERYTARQEKGYVANWFFGRVAANLML
jgi:hypothetical protein